MDYNPPSKKQSAPIPNGVAMLYFDAIDDNEAAEKTKALIAQVDGKGPV